MKGLSLICLLSACAVLAEGCSGGGNSTSGTGGSGNGGVGATGGVAGGAGTGGAGATTGVGGAAGNTGTAGKAGGTGGSGGAAGVGGAASIGDMVSCAGQASGTWISMSKTNAPYPGSGAGLFWTGTELYTYVYVTAAMVDAALYTPCADTWRASPTPIFPLASFVVQVDSANELLFFGPTLSPPLFAGFDYRQNQQANLSVTGVIPASFTNVVTTGSKLIEWGGAIQRDPKNATSGFDGTQAGAVYDPAAGTWAATTNSGAPSARVAPGVWTGSAFAVWGGHAGDTYMRDTSRYDCAQYPDGAGCAEYGDGALYDPTADAWTPISATGAPSPRFNHVLAWTGDRLLVWGGSTKGTTTNTMNDYLDELPLIDGGLYDPTTKAWTAVAASPVPATAIVSSDYYFVWTGDRLAVGQRVAANGWLYDPHLDTWSTFDAPAGFAGCSRPPLGRAGALIAICNVASPAPLAAMLLLPGETAWRVYPLPSGIAENPSVLWTGKHLFLWGGTFPSPPPPTCPPGIGCDSSAPTPSNAGFMLLP